MIQEVYAIRCGTLRVCRTDQFKTGMLSVSAVLPIKRERVWMTSLLLSVLRRGTVRYPTLADINGRLDYLYGTELSIRNFYRGDSQIIGFSADILNRTFLPNGEDLMGGVLEVMREILFSPLLDEEGLLLSRYVESEKKQQCDNIRALKNNPRAYASERCRSALYENEPCGAGVYGTEEEVMAVTPRQLTEHWHALLSNLTLDCFYVGAEPIDEIRQALEKAFAQVPYGGPLQYAPTVIVRQAAHVRYVNEMLPVGQSQLLVGLRTGTVLGDDAFYACAVCNELLGVSPISKLFVNVRERLSLCYFCFSQYNAYKGTVLIQCGLDSRDRDRAEQEIFAQLSAIATGNFSDDELNAAKKSILNAYRQIADSPAAMENFYFGRALANINITPEACSRAFAAVNRYDVMEAAKRMTTDTVYFLDGVLGEKGEESDEED